MNIKKIYIENYRLLKNFTIDLENELSLIIGKNNTGKTSILRLLNTFLNKSEKTRFSLEDFNLDFKEELFNLLDSNTKCNERIHRFDFKRRSIA